MRFPYKAYADMVAREKESNDTQHDAKRGAAEAEVSESAIDDVEQVDNEFDDEPENEEVSS